MEQDPKNMEERLKTLLPRIEDAKWTWAKTYAKWAPHEYIVQQQNYELHKALAEVIRVYGHRELFKGKPYRVLFIGDYKYWHMENILNRTKVGGYDGIPS